MGIKDKMSKKNQSVFWYFIIVLVSLAIVLCCAVIIWIGYEVVSACRSAQQQYEGDCVEALASVVRDEGQSFTARNDAIWALGQLGDARALPTLEEFYSGEMPEREPWDKTLSQYELQKALALLQGGSNYLAWTWRWAVAE